ncbi:hypothetical protein AC578_4733 [Pseudocercospora eumusae]|uniref:Uncharacterized protein n=1 Tax=Pseudocercospora eumusae TaxID=321146 RepID=A0A139GU98_9PEZI|nr:hypothetical protein AC578_4733 [Pseudocercospora eumusae]
MVSTIIPPKKLPRGAAPAPQPKGLLQRYQARYMGNKASPWPLVHVIGTLMAFGYAQNYYFHLREYDRGQLRRKGKTNEDAGHHKNNAH